MAMLLGLLVINRASQLFLLFSKWFLLYLAMLLANSEECTPDAKKAQCVRTSPVREAVVPTNTEKTDSVQSSSLPGSLSPSVLGLSHSVTPRHGDGRLLTK